MMDSLEAPTPYNLQSTLVTNEKAQNQNDLQIDKVNRKASPDVEYERFILAPNTPKDFMRQKRKSVQGSHTTKI